ncbi:MAG: GDYXXLXY domain-containing protein [Akkermansia sp.]|nr:GDYXXLXY domain-containing protein [Akkermansia sp.]
MKTDKRLVVLFAVVAAQLVWLAWNYVDRTRELANAPSLLIDCRDYDPRDVFRGDYVSLSATQTVPLELAGKSIHWDADFCNRVNTFWAWDEAEKKHIEHPVMNPLQERAPQMPDSLALQDDSDIPVAVFWRKDAGGISRVVRFEKPGSAADVAAADETRCNMRMRVRAHSLKQDDGQWRRDISVSLSFFAHTWKDLRFYVEEGTGDLYRIWTVELDEKWDSFPATRIRRTVDVAIRENAAPVPRMLYLNGVPYPEAVEQIRNRTFKWLDAPVEQGER